MSELNVVDRDGVRWIELNRPESRNGLTVEFNAQIIEAVQGAQTDDSIRVILLSGAGGHFCSGLDLKSAMQMPQVSMEERNENMRLYFHGLIRAVRGSTRPTIAEVDGAAAGYGCDLALACDMRVVSDRARFAELFVRRGLMPDGGSTFILPRLVGMGRALELMLTGDQVDAAEAHRIGIANRVVPAAELHDAAWVLATQIAKGPPLVHRAIKRSVALALEGTLDQALDNERETQMQLIQSADFVEGVMAFFQKREPSFKGK